jgi:hypothetical protein
MSNETMISLEGKEWNQSPYQDWFQQWLEVQIDWWLEETMQREFCSPSHLLCKTMHETFHLVGQPCSTIATVTRTPKKFNQWTFAEIYKPWKVEACWEQ